jgi:hypothetical protein
MELLRFLRRQQLHLQSEGMGRCRLALDLGHALLVAGEAQAAVALPAGRQPRLLLQRVVELDGILQELRDVGGRA